MLDLMLFFNFPSKADGYSHVADATGPPSRPKPPIPRTRATSSASANSTPGGPASISIGDIAGRSKIYINGLKPPIPRTRATSSASANSTPGGPASISIGDIAGRDRRFTSTAEGHMRMPGSGPTRRSAAQPGEWLLRVDLSGSSADPRTGGKSARSSHPVMIEQSERCCPVSSSADLVVSRGSTASRKWRFMGTPRPPPARGRVGWNR